MEVEVSCIQQKEPGAEKVGHINTLISPLSEVANDANFLRKCWGTSTPPPRIIWGPDPAKKVAFTRAYFRPG